ncbi:hypothetical protein A8990_1374 [Paenibacillus taihuensis]|uniref:Uncharacterized protein n=1 Tax=Paenibacillus taihuensis TaxID=1156355 RepID=A0A3D9QWR1_9BACL|nr:hypothetical protein A8990_1374 [Paenibacillus taihuensis]
MPLTPAIWTGVSFFRLARNVQHNMSGAVTCLAKIVSLRCFVLFEKVAFTPSSFAPSWEG